MMDVAMLLGRSAVFAHLGDENRAALADAFRVAEYEDGHVFLREGEAGSAVYMVVSGEVQVLRREAEMNVLPPGSLFGLMALVDGGPRSATCRAAGPCRVARLERPAADELFARSPAVDCAFQRAIARQLARDFRRLHERLRRRLGSTGRAHTRP